MKKLFIYALSAIILVTAGVISYLLFTGPRMYVQPSIRTFQAEMPLISPNSIPVVNPYEPLPAEEHAIKLKNPIAQTPENYAKGKVYYGYYCVFCHGDNGDGSGPVGHSYVPVPTDLRTPKVQSLSDGRLLVSMLTGTGHSPMLQRIVLPQYRWYLVLYVRQLALSPDTSPPAPADSSTPPR